MTHTSRRLATMAAAVASVSLLTAGLAGPVGAQDKLILDVVSLRPGDSEQAYHAFDAQVAQFEAANPDIDIVAHEYNWTGPTFTAALAGGTLPDVFTIPFTDGKSLIEQGQLADITDLVNALPYASKFNPNVLATAQDADGHIFGLPRQAYGIGLQYNRDLFTQAGLDPDKPPTTWDEVRAAAKAIADTASVAPPKTWPALVASGTSHAISPNSGKATKQLLRLRSQWSGDRGSYWRWRRGSCCFLAASWVR